MMEQEIKALREEIARLREQIVVLEARVGNQHGNPIVQPLRFLQHLQGLPANVVAR